MNWVKAGTTFQGMNKSFAGATPPAIPKPPRGDASGGLAAARPRPTTPVQPAQPVQQPQQPAAQPAAAPGLGGGMMGMLSQLGTPQGFSAAAGMMPGLFKGLSSFGMPAVMGTYGYLNSLGGGQGAKDWQTLTNPNYKAGSFIKGAANPWVSQGIQIGRRLPALEMEMAHPAASVATRNPWVNLPNVVHAGLDTGLNAAQALPPDDVKAGNPLPTIGKHFAMDMGRREAMHQALNRSVKYWGPKLGIQSASKIPGIKGGFLWDTPINALEDVGDFAGVMPYWAGGKGDTLWFDPKRDNQGQLQFDENGNVVGRSGWNPKALGNWDMRQHDRDTTPDGKWGFGMMQTGIPGVDNTMSYAGSSVNAYNHPLKSLYSLERFQDRDMNLTRDWGALRHPGGLRSPGYQAQSIPGIYAQHYALKTDQPNQEFMPGGSRHEAEKEIWTRRGKYHPVYNPGESSGKPWSAYLGF
jgi:hypothetical protein